VKYDAVVFDLLTALIDSWTLWNDVAGSPDAGLAWRRRYLEITYGCGAYRPYETLVRDAARDVGLPQSLGDDLDKRWDELKPWPEAREVLKRLSVPMAVATNCSIRLGRRAADRVGVPFKVVVTAESVGFYKPRPEPYRAVLAALGTAPERTLFVADARQAR
jgi:HAD superfamily hydrolase (TIGR01493 family)